ncbi:DUF11 domain-containing protein [Latilactobacillus fuchuensis]|uniref:DUF11 domain-containing protein n=2 Tax=Latilactobacillus fuchuensis TaxID=164393 RepID=A0A2N9DVG2_9LACO|nr:DUF11 domain-containing protein [Latilactobacillus fuchuensis]SPC38524.1 hypothetical protein LFUMFP_250026 [Latilactobacillus fuchuensis]
MRKIFISISLSLMVLIGIGGILWGPQLLAGDATVTDLTLKTTVKAQTILVDVDDQNPNDQKIVMPLPKNIDYQQTSYANAAVTVDQANQQLVIDWLAGQPKQIQIKLTAAEPGDYQMKLQTVRDGVSVESKPVVAQTTAPKVATNNSSVIVNRTAAVAKVTGRAMTMNDSDVYSLSGYNLSRLTAADLTNNIVKVIESVTYPTNTAVYNNDISYYNGKLYTFNSAAGTFAIWNANGTHTVSKKYNQAVGKMTVSTISADGQFYGYYSDGTNFHLSKLNSNTGDFSDKVLVFNTDDEKKIFGINGDSVVDGDGYIWKASNYVSNNVSTAYVQKIDVTSGKVLQTIHVRLADGSYKISSIVALAFLPNGQLVIGGENKFGTINLSTGVVSYMSGTLASGDIASGSTPYLNTHLTADLSASPTVDTLLRRDDVVTYTLKVANDGNLASSNTAVTNAMPAGTTYVPNSTMLNGASAADVNGTSPLVAGLPIKSASSADGVVGKGQPVTITYKVKVNRNVKDQDKIIDQATVKSQNNADLTSNQLTHTVSIVNPPKAQYAVQVLNNYTVPDDKRILLGDQLQVRYQVKNAQSSNSAFQKDKATWSFKLPEGADLDSTEATINKSYGTSTTVPVSQIYDAKTRLITINSATVGDFKLDAQDTVSVDLKVQVSDSDLSLVGENIESVHTVSGTDLNGDQQTLTSDGAIGYGPIYSGKLRFKEVPATISFADSRIASKTTESKRKLADWKIIVDDSRRRKNNWHVTAKLSTPFESTDGSQLAGDSLVFRKTDTADQYIDSTSNVDVYDGISTTTEDDYDISWAAANGPLLQIAPGTAKVGTYQGTLQWTLIDAPV